MDYPQPPPYLYPEDETRKRSNESMSMIVQCGSEEEDMQVCTADEKKKDKRRRKKKKLLYDKIRTQMEFYFSDANITKNRLMLEMISATEFVPLQKFLDFNRIKNVTHSVDDVKRALDRSEKLELSKDRSGVKRKVPYDSEKLKSDAEIEECTVYVENVPRHVDHAWLEKVFLSFGPIAYVSLPKFKISCQPKGFAFIEYEKKESADGCIEAYQGEGAVLPEDMDPAHLMSVQTFNEEQELNNKKSDTPRSQILQPDSAKSPSTTTVEPENSRKRKIEKDEEIVGEAPKKRKEHHLLQAIQKPKEDVEDKEKTSIAADTTTNPVNVKIETESEAELEADGNGENKDNDEKKKKRNRKKNKTTKPDEEKLEVDSIHLRVMPKRTWRQLRNRYLNLQRQNMSKLKQQLRQENLRRQHYANCQPQQEESKKPGNIVEIQLDTPAESVEAFKTQVLVDLSGQSQEEAEISQFVKYVDYEEGGSKAYIRFSDDESFVERIQTFVQNADKVFRGVKVLTAQESLDYKARVQLALKNKKRTVPRKKERGKDRLLRAAAASSQHIRFDGEDIAANNEAEGSEVISTSSNGKETAPTQDFDNSVKVEEPESTTE